MKKIRCIIETVLAILMIAVLIFGIKNDIAPKNVFNETVLKPEGTWSEKMLASDEIVQYEYDVPKSQNEKNWIMMLKTHWVDFEIFADDVKCSHGAASGELDEEQLFYMRSRGIDAEEARRMLVEAFLDDALLQIENENVRNWLKGKI